MTAQCAAEPLRAFIVSPDSEDLLLALGQPSMEHTVDPVLVVTRKNHFDLVTSRLDGVPLYSINDAYAGRPAPGFVPDTLAVDGELLEQMRPWLPMAMLQVDRRNWSGSSLAASHRLVARHIAIWSHLMDVLEPEVVFWNDAPHRCFDYVLYGLCRLRGVPTGMTGATSLRDRLVIQERIEDPPLCLFPEAERVPEAAVDPMLDSVYAAYLAANDLNVRGNLSSVWSPGRSLLRRVGDLRRTPTDFPEVVPDRRVRWYSKALKGIANRRAVRSNFKMYETSAAAAEGSSPFVYHALHYQPESTTAPRGGDLWEQVNTVRLVLAGVPRDWRVVVKEHPAMMRYRLDWDRARGEAFYRELLSLPRVELVPVTTPSSALIGDARFVATTTGTVGWEAVLAGTPTLAFGSAWYAEAPGVHQVTSADAVRRAVDRDGRDSRGPDLRDEVREFVRTFVPRSTFYGSWEAWSLDDRGIDGEDGVMSYARALDSFVRLINTRSAEQ